MGKAAAAAVVICLIGLAVAYAMLRGYLYSDAFRRLLSTEVSKAVDVSGEFAPFRWDGLAVTTNSFEATGEGPITALRADGLHTEVGLGGVRRGVWEIRGSTVRRLEVAIDTTKPRPSAPATSARGEQPPAGKTRSWIPREAELQELHIREILLQAVLKQGPLTASGIALHAEHAGTGHSYRGDLAGGTILLPFAFLPELRLDRARLRYQDGRVFLTDATVGAWDHAKLTGSGEADLKAGQFTVQGDATGVKCEDILNPDWAKRLTGNVTSDFMVQNHGGSPTASGELTIHNGLLTALPMLDVLAAYADTRRFRELTLSEAHTRWRWQDGEFLLSDLVLASEGLVRLEGRIDIRNRNIDGVFRLGLAPGTLATIPGAETDVFLPGERGLLWTTLRLTGTLDDPEEDLTERLVAAAGARMFEYLPETGEKVLKFTRSIFGEPSSRTIDRGVEIIGKGADTVREVGGILGGILGRGEPPPAPRNPDQTQ